MSDDQASLSLNGKLALHYAARGFYVFPCGSTSNKAFDKKPLVAHWRDESTRDLETIVRWWRQHPDALVALDCGKCAIVVVDADRHADSPDGVAKLKGHVGDDLGALGCPIVETPGNGLHLYFSQPGAEPPFGNSNGELAGQGIDVRGDGGYIIAPGSVRYDGAVYHPVEGTPDLAECWNLRAIPQVPDVISRLIRAPKAGPEDVFGGDADARWTAGRATAGARERAWAQAALAGKKVELAETKKGGRNNATNAIAYSMGRIIGAGWISSDEVMASLTEACRENGLAREDPRGCAATLARALKDGMAKPRGPLSDRDFGDDGDPIIIDDDHACASGAGSASAKTPNSNWSDPKPVHADLLPVPEFDPAFLPRSLAEWVADISDRMQCPPDFVGVAALVAMGSILGRKVAIRPQRRTDWTEVANLWGCIIGRPGMLKSPAMGEALKPINKLETEARKENEEALAEFKRAERVHALKVKASERKATKMNAEDIDDEILAGDAPEPPRMRRYVLNDTTYESLGLAMAHNPDGVLAFRDELISLLKYLDDERNSSARGFYLTAWNGTSGYTFDRIVRGSTHIEAACLSLLGSTQPGRLAEYISRSQGAGDDGMIQRFGLLVWPNQSPEWENVDRYPISEARKAAWATFERLDNVTPASVGAEVCDFGGLPFLRFDAAAQELFDDWRKGLEFRLRSGDLTPALESHLAKFRKLVPAIAIASHLADNGYGPITEGAALRALAIAEYAEAHARRCYGAGSQTKAAGAKAIIAHIRKGDLKEDFSLRDVMRKGWSGLSDHDQIDAALGLLEDHGWIAQKTVRTGGRPSTVYSINPAALS
ncbi:DUF3987 domain-containing protein [Rhodoblastus sp.]|jgi:hypothetical protein|uniref:DUF3987 domain-containing protein n=1 Tax=Rhodoblastus sp. TaxID=1962975 RepID=UPI0025DDB341|nr:DUF3987 domain-containing protein [Rhodoblastus sp.]